MGEQPFEDLMAAADPPLVIVTTSAEGRPAGCLVGFHMQSSIEPQHYCVWLSKANHTYRVALRSTHLAVHFLTADDVDLAEHFGTTTGEDTDKFAGLRFEEGLGGVPLLADLPHRLIGARSAMLDLRGDHACVELAVEEAWSDGRFEPLRLRAVRHLSPGHEAEERSVHPDG